MKRSIKRSDSRIGFIDEIRGFAIICMVLYHYANIICVRYSIDIPLIRSVGLDVLRDFFAGMFIFISGVSCRLSRSNLKRGIVCFLMGMIVSLATFVYNKQDMVMFGILHLLGASMVIFALAHPLLDRIKVRHGMLISLALFVFSWRLKDGFAGIPYLYEFTLPGKLYSLGWLFPFGFKSPEFVSSDYFPMFPWLFVFIAGGFAGVSLTSRPIPAWLNKTRIRFLAAAGKYTLWIYLLHIPLIYCVMWLLV